MNKEINNFSLNKRIDDFKKRYNELLNELDNSSFLNITKFSNSDWIEAASNENITSLLEENEQVNKNLEILKNSIKQKIKNLELLSQKSLANASEDQYLRTYEEVIADERVEYDEFKNMSFYRVYDDIDRTINKIDAIKEYIEEKILVKIEESEQEKLELTTILDSLNRRIQQLLSEKKFGNKIIDELKNTNEQMQLECDKSISLWMNLSTQLDNLSLLMDESEQQAKEVNAEKDKLIVQLETKINDLLFERAEAQANIETNIAETYINNIADIFVDALHQVFFDLLKKIFKNENKYGVKAKIINENFEELSSKISNISKINKDLDDSILEIEEFNTVEFSEKNNDYINAFKQIKIVEDISSIFNEFYLSKINYLNIKFDQIINLVSEIHELFETKFNGKSIKKINSIITESNSYKEKMNLFAQQINSFLLKLTPYIETQISSNLIDEQYWTNVALFFDFVVVDLNNEIKLLENIKSIFLNHLLPKIEELETSDESQVETVELAEDAYEDHETIVDEEQLDGNYVYVDELEHAYDELDQNYVEGAFEQAFEEQAKEEVEEQKPLTEAEIIENELNEIANEYLSSALLSEEFTQENNDVEINDSITSENYDVQVSDNLNNDQIDKVYDDFVNEQSNDDLLAIINSNDTVSEKVVDNNILSDVMNEIQQYIDMCDESESEYTNKLVELMNDKSTTIEGKIDNIQKILHEILHKRNDEEKYRNLLIQKKYNKNLKLRLIKSKLFNIKLRLDASLDEKYLEIIESLKG